MKQFNEDALNNIEKQRLQWERNELKRSLDKSTEQDFKTLSGINVGRLFTPEALKDQHFESDIGFPGAYPFTRGAYPTMYRGQQWTRRQIAGFGTAHSTNQRFRFLLANGQTGISTDFDHPTLTGYDSDSELADGEVGRVGVAIDSIGDMEDLFNGIPLEQVGISFTINHPAIAILAMFLGVAESRNVPWNALRGTVQNDSLKEFHGQKTFALPPEPSLKLTTDIVEYCTKHVPNWYTISISGYHTREAGANAIQELAFTLAQGMAYAESAISRGLKIDEFAPRFSYFFGCHNDLFEEISKFRAARRMWARIVKDRYQAENSDSMRMRFHTQTLGSTLVREGPKNNITRGALQGLAAVLGGTQSLHISGYDEAYDIPSEDAMKVSLDTQLVLANEANVAYTVDPLAGSYFIESLTDTIEEKAWHYIEKIEQFGNGSMVKGMLNAIENGYIEGEIAKTAFEYQASIENRERVIVGVNKYQSKAAEPNEIFEFDEKEEERQLNRLKKIKSTRSTSNVDASVYKIQKHADSNENIFPSVIEAVKVNTTEEEIMTALRTVYGEYNDPGVF